YSTPIWARDRFPSRRAMRNASRGPTWTYARVSVSATMWTVAGPLRSGGPTRTAGLRRGGPPPARPGRAAPRPPRPSQCLRKAGGGRLDLGLENPLDQVGQVDLVQDGRAEPVVGHVDV